MRNLLLILLASVAFAGETVNPALKPSLDTYETDVSKAYADYLKAINKVNDKVAKDLDAKLKGAMKKGDLDLATAIKSQMDEIAKGKTRTDLEAKWNAEMAKNPADLLGGPVVAAVDPLVGKWSLAPENGWEFKADGTGIRFSGTSQMPIKWAKTDAGYTVTFPAFNQTKPLVFQGKDSIQIQPGLYPRVK
jgi:hypothetical protein